MVDGETKRVAAYRLTNPNLHISKLVMLSRFGGQCGLEGIQGSGEGWLKGGRGGGRRGSEDILNAILGKITTAVGSLQSLLLFDYVVDPRRASAQQSGRLQVW